jgi:hypothetical protein
MNSMSSMTVHEYFMNEIHNSFVNCSWIIHECAMNLLLDSSRCCRNDEHLRIFILINCSWISWILECSWIFHKIHNLFINYSWIVNEGAMNLLLDNSWCCRNNEHSWISMFMNSRMLMNISWIRFMIYS